MHKDHSFGKGAGKKNTAKGPVSSTTKQYPMKSSKQPVKSPKG